MPVVLASKERLNVLLGRGEEASGGGADVGDSKKPTGSRLSQRLSPISSFI